MQKQTLQLDKKALLISWIVAFILSIWGISMAMYTKSDAIMMDGAFNLLSGFLSIVGIVVSGMTARSYGPSFLWLLCL